MQGRKAEPIAACPNPLMAFDEGIEMPAIKPMIGLKFGRLTPVARTGSGSSGKAKWRCLCDCGSEVEVLGDNLRSGNTSSCGCLNVEKISERSTTHGMAEHPAYTSYTAAKNRCRNQASPKYPIYGGRGIEFRFPSFEQFWKELGPTWQPGLSIDRKDNNGHYEPGNCRWATNIEQSNNQRNNVVINYQGAESTLKSWCKELNLNYGTVHSRVSRGWTPEAAFTTPCSPFKVK